ncbi:hypothetical protein GN074_08120 [Helicobacter pylori]|nr:hypothetical protein [Helicobacter pylori]
MAKPSLKRLEGAITRNLAALGHTVSGFSSASGGVLRDNDMYEVYVFTLLLKAAEEQGLSVGLVNLHPRGGSGLEARFRASPGDLHAGPGCTFGVVTPLPPLWKYLARGAPLDLSTYVRMNHPFLRRLWPWLAEVHTGVKVMGHSGVAHEADLLVLPTWEAQAARIRKRAPRYWRVHLVGECKFYADKLGLPLGRAFVGLASEIRRGDLVLLTNSARTDSIGALVATRPRLAYIDSLTPTKPAEKMFKQIAGKVWAKHPPMHHR